MNINLGYLMSQLRCNPAAILQAIDNDPLLKKRESGGLVIANASKALFTPLEEHQLYAKGIVYKRDPYRLVALPLVKMYNVGERGVYVGDIQALAADGNRLVITPKLDGTLVMAFQDDDGVIRWATRGVLDCCDASDPESNFDYIGEAKKIAAEKYPDVFSEEVICEGLTLIFELIHPDARVITNYGDRRDLVLLAVTDVYRGKFHCWKHSEVVWFAGEIGLSVVKPIVPDGNNLAEQLETLQQSWKGTDTEGVVISIESPAEVVYRAKVKSADYLAMLRMMTHCTYDRTVEIVEQNGIQDWAQLERHLKSMGSDKVPEEVMTAYGEHYNQYLTNYWRAETVVMFVTAKRMQICNQIGYELSKEKRKEYALLAKSYPYPGLLFQSLDNKLSPESILKMCSDGSELTVMMDKTLEAVRTNQEGQ